MSIHFDLDGQTAPESTRGFFDPLESPSSRKAELADKCRSIELTPRVHNKSFVSSKQQSNRNSGLHTVNEEDLYHHQRQRNDIDANHLDSTPSIFQRKQRSSVAHFNSFPIGKSLVADDSPNHLSRADVLAETEAKLNGQKPPYRSQFDHEQRQNRRLSEPSGSRMYHQFNQQKADDHMYNNAPMMNNNLNKRMSFQFNSSSRPMTNDNSNKRLSLQSRLNFMETDKRSSMRDWRSRSPTSPSSSSGTTTPVLSSSSTSLSSRPNSTISVMNYHRLSTGSMMENGGHQRKPLFASHLPFSSVVPHLKSNLLVSGLLRVNKRNRSDAYVLCEELNADIYICGSRDRNRALEGDYVAVKLIEVEQVMLEKHEKEEAKLARNNGNPVIRKPDEEDEKEIIFGGEEDVDLVTPRYCGMVVAILERAQKQVFSGTLGLTRPSNKRFKTGNEDSHQRDSSQPRIIWFKPTDKRVPLIAIPVEQAPPGFIENSESFENRLFLGSIKRWPITSLHPFGVLENELGLVDDIHVQVQAILADNNLIHPPFSESLLETIPNGVDIIQQEIDSKMRSDLRSHRSHRCITIVDEKDGFMENALSITALSDGFFEVGFHVSDITAFVEADSPLDKEASVRAMDVHHTLREKVPLWPDALKQNCTDLVAGQDRLAVSVIWNIESDGRVQETWIGKTVINPTAALTIKDIQEILDSSEATENELESDILSLYTVAQLLRRERSEHALFIKTPQLDIQFDKEEGTPNQISVQQPLEADVILSEFQILANMQVAQKISSHFPDHALLRSQAPPNERKLKDLTRYLNGLGYTIDPESPGQLQQSIDQVDNEEAKSVITALVMKTLSQEKYFCTGAFDINRYRHYATNAPLYTHFTSPSRRYADVIVHRQLDAFLRNDTYFYMDPEIVQKTAQHCNVKTRAVENAHEQAQHLFSSYYLANNTDMSTSRIEDAIVVGVQDGAFDVIVPRFGLERRIHTINLPLKTDVFSPSENVLHLVWIPGKPTVDAGVETSYSDDEEDLIDLGCHDDEFAKRRRSTSIRAIQGEDAFLTQCTFPQENRQLIRPFDFVKVVVTADPVRSPPLIRVLAANPFLMK